MRPSKAHHVSSCSLALHHATATLIPFMAAHRLHASGWSKRKGEIMMARSLPAAAFLLLVSCFSSLQAYIPARYDGFRYPGGGSSDVVVVEAFLDPLCPDSRDAWPPLKQALLHYSSRLSLIVHPFPLPYHDNAFLACRALHIANQLNSSTTYPLLELFFKFQGKYYNAPTHNMSRTDIVADMAKFSVTAVGSSLLPAFQSGFEDPKTDRAARVSFTYGCSRGVFGTPFFFVNGFSLPDAGSAINYSVWRNIIDPLMRENSERWEEEADVWAKSI